jgi:cell division protein FtsL
MLAVSVLFVLSVYVSAYARATETGYKRSDLVSQLKDVRQENEMLRLKLEQLRQPDQIGAYAQSKGMEQSVNMVYLKPAVQPNIARNID